MTAGITLVFLAVVVVGMPLALGALDDLEEATTHRWSRLVRRAALPGAIGLVASFLSTPGPGAGLVALPWLVVAGAAAGLGALALMHGLHGPALGRRLATSAALAFLAVGAAHAVSDRLGSQPFGFSPIIVLLTAVHFHVAGVVLVVAGLLAAERRGSVVAGTGVAAVIIGIPITALGFFGLPIASLAGSLAVSIGGMAIAASTLRSLPTFRHASARLLGGIAGLSLLVAMPLAVIYAVGVFLGSDWIDLPTMARTHGVLNGLGFAIPAMVAWRIER